MTKALLVTRGPPELAIRVAPTSPEALQRLAERALTNDRITEAASLSEQALSGAPFSIRALRVRGLAAARNGETDKAEQILTLAGNWSLRDDPAHAWLVENRLRNGDYGSAFAHADTLARRRLEMQPGIFNLFTTAALNDPRSVSPLLRQMANDPPWRLAYLDYLYERDDGDAVLLTLATGLERTKTPFTRNELEKLYLSWTADRRYLALRTVRGMLRRPPFSPAVVNGDFSADPQTQLLPFTWRLGAAPGLIAEVAEDDLRPRNAALRIDYDGVGSDIFADQVLMLSPGRYLLRGEGRMESSPVPARITVELTCVESGLRLLTYRPEAAPGSSAAWRRFQAPATVPTSGCSIQILHFAPDPGDAPASTIAWFDNLELNPLAQ
ncbi:lipopolysaccharide assembly protein LapB [Brevundimonas sp. Root1423]|uniref:tetratricopeptide repeat protein n=1 Tax=Brevundimonas sp. Root1423 TaxID=1736462 RepID=UPI000A9ECAD4|nr:hypothetical protein [Brevundimonas sp. Root1423]